MFLKILFSFYFCSCEDFISECANIHVSGWGCRWGTHTQTNTYTLLMLQDIWTNCKDYPAIGYHWAPLCMCWSHLFSLGRWAVHSQSESIRARTSVCVVHTQDNTIFALPTISAELFISCRFWRFQRKFPKFEGRIRCLKQLTPMQPSCKNVWQTRCVFAFGRIHKLTHVDW